MLTLGNVYANVTGNPGSSPGESCMLAAIASLPLFPIVGFHLNQARRQFRAGHTLADLRSALEIARRERAESEALARRKRAKHRTPGAANRHRRLGDAGSPSPFGLLMTGVIHENRTADCVDSFARAQHDAFRRGEQRARRAVHSHEDPQLVADGDSRSALEQPRWGMARAPTRRAGAVARGGCRRVSARRKRRSASPRQSFSRRCRKPYREQLSELPAIVAALEARAAEARAEVDVVAALARPDSDDASVLESTARRGIGAISPRASPRWRGIRLDLLRLHAGAGDCAAHDADRRGAPAR